MLQAFLSLVARVVVIAFPWLAVHAFAFDRLQAPPAIQSIIGDAVVVLVPIRRRRHIAGQITAVVCFLFIYLLLIVPIFQFLLRDLAVPVLIQIFLYRILLLLRDFAIVVGIHEVIGHLLLVLQM